MRSQTKQRRAGATTRRVAVSAKVIWFVIALSTLCTQSVQAEWAPIDGYYVVSLHENNSWYTANTAAQACMDAVNAFKIAVGSSVVETSCTPDLTNSSGSKACNCSTQGGVRYYQTRCGTGLQFDPVTGGCATPSEALHCNDQAVKDTLQEWKIFEQNVQQVTYLSIPNETLTSIDPSYTLSDFTYQQCVLEGSDISDTHGAGAQLHCAVTYSATQEMSGDFSVKETRTIAAINDASSPDGTGTDCPPGNIILNSQSNTIIDLSLYAAKSSTQVTSGGVTTDTENQTYQTNDYDEETGTTKECTVTVSSTDSGAGGSTSTSKQCTTVTGDSTKEQAGSGTNVVDDGTGQLSAVSNSTGNTTTPQGTPEIALVEVEGDCDDPNGCEDFAEIIEEYDEAANQAKLDGHEADIETALQDELTDFTVVSNDPGSLLGGLTAGDISSVGSIFPNGQVCIPFLVGTFEGQAITIPCEVTEGVRTLLTFVIWVMLGMYIRTTFIGTRV